MDRWLLLRLAVRMRRVILVQEFLELGCTFRRSETFGVNLFILTSKLIDHLSKPFDGRLHLGNDLSLPTPVETRLKRGHAAKLLEDRLDLMRMHLLMRRRD